MNSAFTLHKPKNSQKSIPLIFDSPHSGQNYPKDFDYICPFEILQRAEDNFIDLLFAHVTEIGSPLLCANFPRSYIDPNRAIDDIDPALIKGEWPADTPPHTINPTTRSDAGIGLIRRLIRPGKPIYNRSLTPKEITQRIKNQYEPYHKELSTLIYDAHYKFGQVWHINCHSMPNSTAKPKRAITMAGNKIKPSDFVLGNRDGTTCSTEFTHIIRDFLKNLGLTVTINDPFKGVELVERYSNPTRGFHSLQLEINKALYMDEETCTKNKNYDTLQGTLKNLTAHCANYVESKTREQTVD